VRPVGVVVLDVDAQHALELSSARDQQPIEAVAADRADPAFGEGVRVGCPIRGADDLDALAPKTSSKARLNLLSRSRIRNRIGFERSGSEHAACQAR